MAAKRLGLYLGVDVGSVSTNLVLLNEEAGLVRKLYLRSQGDPVGSVQRGLIELCAGIDPAQIAGAGTTGSGRELIGRLLGADLIKNEITAHTVGALHCEPEARTILEIGGQDSKLILIRDGIISDFAMNTVCAAGTGSFLDQQATRLNISVAELGRRAAQGKRPVRIAGRCAVFAESDMVHKQQMGHSLDDILAGLCRALAQNFLTNLAKGKELQPPFVFQGGVAANAGIRRAFTDLLHHELLIPEHYDVMGAIGIALLVRAELRAGKSTSFTGFRFLHEPIQTTSFDCDGCANQCEVVELRQSGRVLAVMGDKCAKWSGALTGSVFDEPKVEAG